MIKLKNISPVVVVGIVLTLVCFSLYISDSGFIRAVSNYVYDAFVRQVCKEPQSGKVVIADIDDESLKEFGQWPWPRYLVSEMTQQILDSGASVVAFDVVFAERDRTSPAVVRDSMAKHFKVNVDITGAPQELMDFDARFAKVLKSGRTILGCFMKPSDALVEQVDTSAHPNYTQYLTDKDEAGGQGSIYPHLMQASGITISIPILTEAASTAFFNANPGEDGIVRSNPLVWTFGPERKYPSLALEAVRMYRKATRCIIKFDRNGVTQILMPPAGPDQKALVIPADASASLMVNYRKVNKDAQTGFTSSFPVFRATDIIHGRIPTNALTGKIVFIGTSAVGLKDVKATPVTQYFSGVEVHATMVDNMLAGDMLWNPYWMITVQAMSIVLIGTFLTIFISRGRSWLSFVVSVVLIALSVKLSFLLIDRYHLVFVPAWVILSICVIYPVLTMIKFWQEELQKKQVRNMFGTMVSEKVLHYMERNPGSFTLSGQRAEATMFFSDVAGFTTISESLEPAKLSELLNRYLSPMTHIIMERGGYVDKYEGDLIMAEWGVPFAMEDHAVQGCLAAIEQQDELAELRPWLRKAFGHDVYVRMGLNSGIVTAGNMGSDRRFQYTVMGDAVNQAARFEPVNKDYGTSICIGETTFQGAQHAIEARLLDRIIVKGKTKPIAIYELLGKKGNVSDRKLEVVSLYGEAMRLHWERQWDAALEKLDHALRLDGRDGPSARMRTRILWYKGNPPPDSWAGEYVRETKD